MTHLSEVQAELNAQNSHHSDKTQASKQREEELQRRLDVLIEENEQLHETRFVGCVVCFDYYIYIYIGTFTSYLLFSSSVVSCSLLDSSTALDTTIDNLRNGCLMSDHEMEETINSLQKVIHIYMKQTSTNTENSFMFSC